MEDVTPPKSRSRQPREVDVKAMGWETAVSIMRHHSLLSATPHPPLPPASLPPSGQANPSVLFKPSTIMFVLGLGALIDYFVGYVPKPGNNLSLVSPLIGPCLVLIPIMGYVEYRHRGSFLPILRRIVGSSDIRDPGSYYQGGRSKCLIFEHAGQTIGVVCLDAKRPGEAVESVLGDGKDGSRGPIPAASQSTGSTTATEKTSSGGELKQRSGAGAGKAAANQTDAEIRHLTCDLQFRHNGVGTELIAAALDHAFGIAADGSPTQNTGILRVIICTNPFTRGGEEVWEKTGFKPIKVPDANWRTPYVYGIGKWQGRWMGILKQDWLKRREYLFREGQPQQKETQTPTPPQTEAPTQDQTKAE